MKLFKHSLLKITLLLLIICSCTNDDAIVDCNEATIASYLVECPWDVTMSNNLLTYTFNNDQTLSIISSDNTFSTTGTWNTSTNNSGQIVVTIVEQFNDFNDEWVFNDCNFADLQVVSTNNPDTIININCSNDTEDCTENTIASYLVECPWDVTMSNNLLTYIFNNDQTLSIISSNNTLSTTGTWSTSTNTSGQIVVTIVEQFNDFNDEWIFNDCNFEALQVVSTNNPDTIININCSNDTEDCTESIVAGILLECPWDVTVSNNLFTYTFNNDQTLSINLINTTTTGTWSTSTNTSGQIVVTIVEQFNDFNDEWIFNDCDLEALQVLSTNNPDAIININCN